MKKERKKEKKFLGGGDVGGEKKGREEMNEDFR